MTLPTGVDFMKYSDEELTAMLAEAGEASKHARKRGRVMGIVAAHRLKQMRELLMYEELAIWRRENGFDRGEAVEKKWFGDHRSLPPTPGAIPCRLVVRGECVERFNFDTAPGLATHQRN